MRKMILEDLFGECLVLCYIATYAVLNADETRIWTDYVEIAEPTDEELLRDMDGPFYDGTIETVFINPHD